MNYINLTKLGNTSNGAALSLYTSQVSISNKQLNLGGFDSEIDAAKARDKYVYENNLPHRLNFPEDYPSRDGENNK